MTALLKGQSETHTDKLSTFKNISLSETKQALWFPSQPSEKSATPKYCSDLCHPVRDSNARTRGFKGMSFQGTVSNIKDSVNISS